MLQEIVSGMRFIAPYPPEKVRMVQCVADLIVKSWLADFDPGDDGGNGGTLDVHRIPNAPVERSRRVEA